ncbi:uncharacterized protein BDV14DRAFT_174268 [Aspergillus stella-maris]|uniref:uncharacterized protein n=1 Tax=Aspergillus stella-maris TaxID=1810926 RepID=UPI003CCD1961
MLFARLHERVCIVRTRFTSQTTTPLLGPSLTFHFLLLLTYNTPSHTHRTSHCFQSLSPDQYKPRSLFFQPLNFKSRPQSSTRVENTS